MCTFYFSPKVLAFFLRCKWFLGRDGILKKFSQKDYDRLISHVIEPMASDGLRTICLAYKDYVNGGQIKENQVFCFSFSNHEFNEVLANFFLIFIIICVRSILWAKLIGIMKMQS